MSTLLEEIARIERQLKDEKSTQKISKLRGRLEGLRQRQLNHENLQVEIATHIAWINDMDDCTEVYR